MREHASKATLINYLISSVNSKIEKNGWKECPSCMEQWTQLRPCIYWDEFGKQAWVSLCVQCAETPSKMDWVVARDPIHGYDCKIVFKGPRFVKVRFSGSDSSKPSSNVNHELKRNAVAFIRGGDVEFVVTSAGTGQPIQFKEKKDEYPQFADNTLRAWSMIRARIIRGFWNE